MPLDGHNSTADFIEARTDAQGRHQTAICEAHTKFKQAEAEAWRIRNLDYQAAKDQWDAVKSYPNHPDHSEMRDAFQRSKAPASLANARRQLAEAINRADQDYKAALVRIGQAHNVTVH
jgi:hypothetical protein